MNEEYMKIAIELAKKGSGKVNPNPKVGAVIVKANRIIGTGYHEEYGMEHAEIKAFNSLTENSMGATMYVTLEPCSHYGKTPPCVDKIIENKISKVIVGCYDPNPLVSGKGIEKLRNAGIEVITGVLEAECKTINEVFFKYITEKKPFVILKCAMSLDGKIATTNGESKYITSKESRHEVHKVRNDLSAIMVGVNTVIKDDPELTCRIEDGRNPIRIILDSNLRIPLESKVVTNRDNKTIIATTNVADKNKISILEEKGVKVVVVNSRNKKIDLQSLMAKLVEINIDGILLEGGSTVNFSALEENIVDKVQIFISPKIIGGEYSKTPVGGKGITELGNAFKVKNMTTKFIGEDILIEGYL